MKEVTKLIEMLHPLERKILPFLKEGITTQELISQSGLSDAEVLRAVQWMGNKHILQTTKQTKHMVFLIRMENSISKKDCLNDDSCRFWNSNHCLFRMCAGRS